MTDAILPAHELAIEVGAWRLMAKQTGARDEDRSGRRTMPDDVLHLVTTLRKWLADAQQALVDSQVDGPAKSIETHEENAQNFVEQVNAILIDAIRLSPTVSPDVFKRVADLRRTLRILFEDGAEMASKQAKARIQQALFHACPVNTQRLHR